MTSDAAIVEHSLREMARLSADRMSTAEGRTDMASRARQARREAVVDMASEAIDARLQHMAAMTALCVELAAAGDAQGGDR